MNKKFTKLIAALALLVFMTPTMAGWGQTRTEEVSSLVFTAACGGSGTADDGVKWTVTSDGTESSFDNTKGIHYGTSSAQVQYIKLTTSQISGTITKVVVNASTASGVTATVDVTVGGSAFGGDPQSTTSSAAEYTFNGSASGEIVVTHTKPQKAAKALYVKSVVVTYTTDGGGGTGGGTGGGGNSGSTQTLTFPFTSNITGWPTTNSTTLTNYTYTLDNVAYTFALNNVKCNTSYLMCTSTAVLGLPAIEGYKLTKVVASNSSGCSTATKVGISSSSSSASYISGGAIQTWSTQGSTYTYNLTSTEANTMYYLYVTNKNAQVVGLELTYEYVTPPAVATPTFSLDGGYYVGTKNVTISCETADATIYYTTDGTTPSASNGTQGTSVSISTTTTLKAIAIKGDDSSSVAEATYTILTPLTTMQQIFDAATNTETTVAVTFDNYVITGKTTTQAYMTDGTKGCMLFGSGHGFNAGDVLSGTVICKLVLYYGKPEFKELTSSTTGISVATGGTVTPVATTIDAVGLINAGSVVTFSNLTYNGSKLSDGTNTIEPYNGVGYSPSFSNGKTYNVTGVFGYGYGSTDDYKRIFPRSASDITEVVAATPTIYANTASLTGFTYAEGNGPSTTQTVSVSGTNLEGNITLAMNNGGDSAFEISLSENGNYSNSVTLTPSEGNVSATTVYVRMKAGLSILAEGYSDEINLTSTNATQVSVSLAGTVTGPEFTWDLTTGTYNSASTEQVQWTNSYATMTVDKNGASSNANAYLNTGTPVTTRFYTGQKLTFAPKSGYTIDHVEITGTSGYVAGIDNNAWVNAASSTSGTTVTITPTDNSKPFYDIISATVRLTSVTVYYAVSTDPFYTITIDDDINNGTVLADYDQATEGTIVTLTINPNTGYYLKDSDLMVLDQNLDDVDVTKVNGVTYTFEMPAYNVTVYASFSVYTGTYYTLVTNTADLVTGRHYIIASSKTPGSAYAMGAQNDNKYREQVAVDVVNNMIYGTENVHEIVLSGDANNYWTLYDEETPGYLHAYNSTSNQLGTRQSNATNENYGQWAININEGVATIVSQVGAYGFSNTIKYNSGNTRFSCYTASSTMAPVYLYMKAGETDYEFYSNTTFNSLTIGELDIYTVHSPAVLNVTGTLTNQGNHENFIIEDGGQLITSSAVAATVKKNITGHGDTGGWNFIASPISADITPAGLITDVLGNIATPENATYDLYYYKEDEHLWKNYRKTPFDMVNGKGYLYANIANTELSFAGTLQPSNAAVTRNLSYTATISGETNTLAGWNLVGNPFPCNATVATTNSSSCYVIEDGAIVSTTGTVASPCSGVMVKATGEGQEVTFTPTTNAASFSTGNNQLQMTVAQNATNRGTAETIDNAIVSFNEGSQLEKFYFGNQDANLYIPQNDKEYAITVSEGQGTLPVNFRANENGTYTLTVNPEGVEMNYLHLIDNMTGADIDLLALRQAQGPASYTFNATTNDYESRFRLVFASNGASTGSATDAAFAFMSDGNWIINNAGEATLQVIDLNGRILSSERVNGSVSKTVNATPGVYMLRLINGDNVKVQKIVVR